MFLTLLLASCNKYNRLLKSSDYDLKYTKAIEYYDKKDYSRALPLLEELITVLRGTIKAERIYYCYAKTQYELGDYLLASYHFKELARTYPNGPYNEEALFLSAYCFYLTSPRYSLDQDNTKSAIEELQLFVNIYPNSNRIEECNNLIDKLRGKLETKAFENAKLYYNIEDYRAAQVSFQNLLKDFPDTKYREEAAFLQIKSAYLLANGSIESKKEERFRKTRELYTKFVDIFPKSKYLNELEKYDEKAAEFLKTIKTS